ncbi:hypothetical protein ACHAWF_009125 [Thalassiosira exigua]
MLFAWIVAVLTASVANRSHRLFWLAYLTNWGLLMTTAYTLASSFGAAYFATRPPVHTGVLEGRVGLFVKKCG